MLLDVGYNDVGFVVAPGAGAVVALALSATVASAWDTTVPTVGPTLPAPPAALVPLGFAPVGPYATSEGGFGYYTFPGTFPIVGAGVGITVAGFTLTGAAAGTTTVAPTTGAALFLVGSPVPATLVSGTVTVPEPATGALLLLGLAVLSGRSRRR